MCESLQLWNHPVFTPKLLTFVRNPRSPLTLNADRNAYRTIPLDINIVLHRRTHARTCHIRRTTPGLANPLPEGRHLLYNGVRHFIVPKCIGIICIWLPQRMSSCNLWPSGNYRGLLIYTTCHSKLRSLPLCHGGPQARKSLFRILLMAHFWKSGELYNAHTSRNPSAQTDAERHNANHKTHTPSSVTGRFQHCLFLGPIRGLGRLLSQLERGLLLFVVGSALHLSLLLHLSDQGPILPSHLTGEPADVGILGAGSQMGDPQCIGHNHSLRLSVQWRDTFERLESAHCFLTTLSLAWQHATHGLEKDHSGSTVMEGSPFRVGVGTLTQVVLEVLAIAMTGTRDVYIFATNYNDLLTVQ